MEKSHIIIHVIEANMIEVDDFEMWEVVLHWLPTLKSLKIVLVGPKLSWDTLMVDVCDRCSERHKNLIIDMHGSLYTEYESSKQFVRPDIVFEFNAGIHENIDSEADTWAASIPIIAKQNCPLILTSCNSRERQRKQERIEVILRSDEIRSYRFHNPYATLRPRRDYETEQVYYQNSLILIYPRLKMVYMNTSKPYLN